MLSYRKQVLEGLILGFITWAYIVQGAPQGEIQVSQSLLQACPAIQGVANFSPKKFDGIWVVGYHFHLPSPPCQIISVSAPSENELKFVSNIIISANLTARGSGQGKVIDSSNPGSMFWNWNYLSTKYERVTVVDTDYDNYAVLVFCTDAESYTQQAAMLWTRDYKATPRYFQTARRLLEPVINLPIEPEVQDACSQPVVIQSQMQILDLDVISSETIDLIVNFNILRLGDYFVKK